MTVILYDFVLDDRCYKVRLMLGFLGVTYERVAVDVYPGGEQATPPLLALNPRGALPILVDGDLVLHESEAILAYLARRYDATDHWLPADDPIHFGQVAMWLAFATDALRPVSEARAEAMFGSGIGGTATAPAEAALRIMDDHMTERGFDGCEWFVGRTPTVADVALFPAFALARDAGIEHDAYPALRRWMRRFRAIPGFTTMPGIPDYH